MGRKQMHTPEEIAAKLRQVAVLVAQGGPVSDAVRAIAVSEATYCRWRAEFGGLKLDEAKRLKELERENARPMACGRPACRAGLTSWRRAGLPSKPC